MRLLVGLGNPGPRYFGTRHNLGFELIDRFAARHGVAVNQARAHGQFGEGRVAGTACALFKPMTYMNLSGAAVAPLLAELPACIPEQDLLLVYDDLDLPCARLRLRKQGGPGGHNGVASVVDALGSEEFARLRFGIGRPPPGGSISDHVLSPFEPDEREAVDRQMDLALALLDCFVEDGADAAIDRLSKAARQAPS